MKYAGKLFGRPGDNRFHVSSHVVSPPSRSGLVVATDFAFNANQTTIDAISTYQFLNHFAAKLAQLFESPGVIVGQFVVIQTQQFQ